MDDIKNLKSYNFTYRTINPDGIINVGYNKKKIAAENQETAINIFRSMLLKDGVSDIRIDRIDRIEDSSAPKVPEKKRKRSILGWLAFSILALAMSGRVIDKLF